jgi:hypothetical protein
MEVMGKIAHHLCGGLVAAVVLQIFSKLKTRHL